MPIILPHGLPAAAILRAEAGMARAPAPAGRPLEVLLVNLMPDKPATELQLARMLDGSPLPVRLTLCRLGRRQGTHTDAAHLSAFYHTLDAVSGRAFDGMIVTGAPIELLEYRQVDYWDEFGALMAFGRARVGASLYLCWAAMAALWRRYGIPKRTLPHKLHGVFAHRAGRQKSRLTAGLDRVFYVPHSRQAEVSRADVTAAGLEVLAESEEAGLHAAGSRGGRELYVFGHMEYDRDTLWREYRRDAAQNPGAPVPRHYFEADDPARPVRFCWRTAGRRFYANWLAGYVGRPALSAALPRPAHADLGSAAVVSPFAPTQKAAKAHGLHLRGGPPKKMMPVKNPGFGGS